MQDNELYYNDNGIGFFAKTIDVQSVGGALAFNAQAGLAISDRFPGARDMIQFANSQPLDPKMDLGGNINLNPPFGDIAVFTFPDRIPSNKCSSFSFQGSTTSPAAARRFGRRLACRFGFRKSSALRKPLRPIDCRRHVRMHWASP